jgi:hypothetical protein
MKKDSAVEWLFNELLGDRVLSKELIELREQALELEKQQQLDLTNITRLEVINHASNRYPIGRILTMYETKDFTVVDAQFQDENRTLKIFIS